MCVYQVSSLSQSVAELEGQLDRAHRDKSSLTNQLEDTHRKLTSQEQDNTKVQCVCKQTLKVFRIEGGKVVEMEFQIHIHVFFSV